MTQADDRWSFVHTGPDTIAGRYLRRFWQPVYESARLAPGQAVPIRILGENFTLYRGEGGRAHVVTHRCPHRGTQLSTGWVEGDDLRCFFHGWKFTPSGACIEQPAEPRPFCDKVRIAAYPTQEQLGLVFAYLGDGPAPALPRWPELESDTAVPSMVVLPCNYFQSAENIVDDVHVRFSHRASPELSSTTRGRIPQRVWADETPFGLTISFQHTELVEQNHYIMPNQCYLSYWLVYRPTPRREIRASMRTLFWYVPIDDVTHHHVQVTVAPAFIAESMKLQAPVDVAAEVAAVVAGRSRYHLEPATAGKPKPELLRIQDGVAVVGQGAIQDRSKERLGTTDAGVILLRKIWARELRALAEGQPLTPFTRPDRLEVKGEPAPAPVGG